MNKKAIIAAAFAAIWFVLGGVCGFFTAKGIYDQPIKESVTRDTVVRHDTIPYHYPNPVDGTQIKTEYRWLTRVVTDTVKEINFLHTNDSVLVEVPIESKHYSAPEYDAYISGYLPNLDSISVYQKTEYITERVVVNKPPNKWELDAVAGIDYNVTSQRYTPYAGGELIYKPSRFQIGIRGGVSRTEKTTPFVGAVVKYNVF